MDFEIFAVLEPSALAGRAQELLTQLRLARHLRTAGSDVGAALIDLAIQFPPMSLVSFQGIVGLVMGYDPKSRSLAVGIPTEGVRLVPEGEAAVAAYWGDLTAARIAKAYDETDEGISFVCVKRHAPFTRVPAIEA